MPANNFAKNSIGGDITSNRMPKLPPVRKGRAIRAIKTIGPYCSSLANDRDRSRGSRPTATLKPSSGAIGIKLNTPRMMLMRTMELR